MEEGTLLITTKEKIKEEEGPTNHRDAMNSDDEKDITNNRARRHRLQVSDTYQSQARVLDKPREDHAPNGDAKLPTC